MVSDNENNYAGTLQWFIELVHCYSEAHTLATTETNFTKQKPSKSRLAKWKTYIYIYIYMFMPLDAFRSFVIEP